MKNKFKKIEEEIMILLGYTSAIFMSQEIKGTEIVMPTEKLTKAGKDTMEKITKILS